MNNHFYISYHGNKRQEVKIIYENINFENIKTVVEPFCGSCAMSYYISTQRKGLKYILNDNNKYLKEMFELMKDDNKITEFEKEFKNKVKSFKDNKEKYNEIVKEDNLLSWFIKHKIYSIRPGLYPSSRKYKETVNLKEFPIYNFFKNNDITFYNEDALSIYQKYKNSKENLILLDPPYINSCNDFYIIKNMNIYEYLCENNIKKEKARIILILENIWIVKLLFKNNKIIHEYQKKYEMKHRKTTHIIIGQK